MSVLERILSFLYYIMISCYNADGIAFVD